MGNIISTMWNAKEKIINVMPACCIKKVKDKRVVAPMKCWTKFCNKKITLVRAVQAGCCAVFLLLIYQSTNQPLNQSTNQPINQSTIESINQSTNQQVLAIIQLDTRYGARPQGDWSTTNYAESTAEINRLYAQKWNYTQLRLTYSSEDNSNMAKVSLLKAVMDHKEEHKTIDWFLYLDSDAYISQTEWDLEEVLKRFNVTEDHHMLVENEPNIPKERYDRICPESHVDISTAMQGGAVLVRNSDIGKEIVDKWFNAIPNYSEELVRRFPGDQGLFSCALSRDKTVGRYIKFDGTQFFMNISGKRWMGYHDAYIQHWTSGDGKSRLREISKVIAELKKDVKEKSKDKMEYTMSRIERRGFAPVNYQIQKKSE